MDSNRRRSHQESTRGQHAARRPRGLKGPIPGSPGDLGPHPNANPSLGPGEMRRANPPVGRPIGPLGARGMCKLTPVGALVPLMGREKTTRGLHAAWGLRGPGLPESQDPPRLSSSKLYLWLIFLDPSHSKSLPLLAVAGSHPGQQKKQFTDASGHMVFTEVFFLASHAA